MITRNCFIAWVIVAAAGTLLTAFAAAQVAGEAQPAAKPLVAPLRTETPQLIVQLGHSDDVASASLSSDGRFVATSDTLGEIWLWEKASGRPLRRMKANIGQVLHVEFSPDNRQILSADWLGTPRLWDTATGKEIRRFEGHTGSVITALLSPDGKEVLTASTDKTARLWEKDTGKEIRRFEGHSHSLWCAAFSANGRLIATGGYDRTARLWDKDTGKEIQRFTGHTGAVLSVDFSSDGKKVLTGSMDETARVWDAGTGKEVLLLPCKWFPDRVCPVVSARFSPNGQFILTAVGSGHPELWDAVAGKHLRVFRPHEFRIDDAFSLSACFSRDGQQVLTAGGGRTACLLDTDTGKETQHFEGHADAVRSAHFLPDGRHLLTAADGHPPVQLWDLSAGGGIPRLHDYYGPSAPVSLSTNGQLLLSRDMELWDVAAGTEIRTLGRDAPRYIGRPNPDELSRLIGYPNVAISVLSPDGRFALSASRPLPERFAHRVDLLLEPRLWDVSTGKEVRRLTGHRGLVRAMAFSPDGRQALTVGDDKTVRLWEVATGQELRRFEGHAKDVLAVAFSPDGRQVLTGSLDGTARFWNPETGKETQRLAAPSGVVGFVAFSPNGRMVLVSDKVENTWVFDAASGKELHRLSGHGYIHYAAFSPDGRWIASAGSDGTTRFWSAATGKELCRLVSFRNGSWAAVDPQGRFDTSSPDKIMGLHWVLPDDPYKPLPIEIFMRDYYEPRLLTRILAGEKFEAIPALQSLNRVQPKVEIARIEADPSASDEVRVSVDVASQTRTLDRDGRQLQVASGVCDLRLFRDGQLVGYRPAGGGAVTLDKNGKATLKFEHVKLPRKLGLKDVEFSAYAFNADRIKSPTSRAVYHLPPIDAPRQGVAYVVCFGVNAFDSPNLNLRFAVNDAQTMAATLTPVLRGTGRFQRVVTVPLISDTLPTVDGGKAASAAATKANLRTVLSRLASDRADDENFRHIPAAAEIRKAQPEDMVLVYFSTHGYTGAKGEFYLSPSDVGPGATLSEEFRERMISTGELSEWLRDVDAEDMVLIVDACHSAASVESGDFKPGPMGSRGLGQLAYDKRMSILAASRSAEAALEDVRLGHGFLAYALCREGIENYLADFDPKDRKIFLREWLKYGVQRVPTLVDDVVNGKLAASQALKRRLIAERGHGRLHGGGGNRVVQQPALFDFSSQADETLLLNVP